jgi:hypothetical protein
VSAKIRAESVPRSGGSLTHQPRRFAGLFLAPLAGLPAAWLIHVWVAGIDLHVGPVDWVVPVSPVAEVIALVLLAWATIGMCWAAWHFTAHREQPKRIALTVSVALLGLLFELNVGGPNYWISPLFVVAGWLVAATWSLARLDVARNDKHGDGDEDREDGLMKKLGISKLTRFRPKVVHDPETGEPTRIDIAVQHAPGETTAVLQDGLGSLESAAAGPPSMSTATADPEDASQSHLSVMLRNPFRRNLRVGPLTAPGGTIADWMSVADYADDRPAFVTFAGGKHQPVSTSYALIGMTRAGKTGTETQLLTECGSRYDWTCLYLNQAKGLQDIRPLLPVIEAAVIAEDGDAGLGDYIVAAQQFQAIMIYRQQELARFGVSAWSPRCAHPNPDRRPTRLAAGGGRIVMARMSFLTMHVGEADAVLSSGRMGESSTYAASKGLSLGMNTGWSLQRPDWKAMPTSLRANIGLWFVHGMNDTDEEEFVLDADVRAAGASPGKWGMRKPGQHFMIGPGIDETRFPIALKTRFLVGSDTNPDGSKVDYDTLNDRYMAEMLKRNLASAPGMMKLDRGSAEATDGWWDDQVRKTDELRVRMLQPESATPAPATPATPATPYRMSAPAVADDDEIDPQEAEEMKAEFAADVAETTEVDGIPLYGDDPDEGRAIRSMDLTGSLHAPEVDCDPLADADEDDKPAALTRQEALAELRRGLVAMVDEPRFADPKIPGTARARVGEIFDFLRLRSQPWVSAELTRILMDGGGIEDGVVAERDGDPRKGFYRFRRTGAMVDAE